jgi:hypothetical protein
MNKIVTRLSEEGCVVRINDKLSTVYRGDEIKTNKDVFLVKSYNFEKDIFWAIKKNEISEVVEVNVNDVVSVVKTGYKGLEKLSDIL